MKSSTKACAVYVRNSGRSIVHVRKRGRAYGPGAEGTKFDVTKRVDVTVSEDGVAVQVSQCGSPPETWPLLGEYNGGAIMLVKDAVVTASLLNVELPVKVVLAKELTPGPTDTPKEEVAPVPPQVSSTAKAIAYAQAKKKRTPT